MSFTDFKPARRRDAPVAALQGLRLAGGWYAMEGAVGLWLWSLPHQRRSGSITVWTSEECLRRFVRLPAHVAIMRHYRERGDIRATTWSAHRVSPEGILARAREWISTSRPAA